MKEIRPLLPLPPSSLMARVTGSEDAQPFDETGAKTADEWSLALGAIGKSFGDFQTVLDFGCGCGRVLRHLWPRLDRTQRLIGADVDSEAVAWIAQNYDGIEAVQFEPNPPCSLETNSVDLIVNQSVFSHLPETVQFAWLAELHRVLKPGAIAILSFHGRKVWQDFVTGLAAAGHAHDASIMTERFNRYGFYYTKGKTPFEKDLPDYYGLTFHTIDYIEQEWLRYFRCRVWLPVASLGHQDILVLERL